MVRGPHSWRTSEDRQAFMDLLANAPSDLQSRLMDLMNSIVFKNELPEGFLEKANAERTRSDERESGTVGGADVVYCAYSGSLLDGGGSSTYKTWSSSERLVDHGNMRSGVDIVAPKSGGYLAILMVNSGNASDSWTYVEATIQVSGSNHTSASFTYKPTSSYAPKVNAVTLFGGALAAGTAMKTYFKIDNSSGTNLVGGATMMVVGFV